MGLILEVLLAVIVGIAALYITLNALMVWALYEDGKHRKHEHDYF